MACRECHLAKVKCDNTQHPCVRCAKRSLKCVPHLSRQGHGRKERRPHRAADEQVCTKKAKVERLEDDVSNHTWKLGPGHYGLHYVIRLWLSYALTRRSISLLGKACGLASKSGITMDELLSGEHPFGDDSTSYMEKILLQPVAKQVVVGPRILLEELPMDLRQAMDLCNHPPGLGERINRDDRWIIVSKRVRGIMQFYVSAAFERDIVSWETINKTFKENKKAVKDLWLTGMDEHLKWTQGWIHQVSLHNVQGIAPCATRAPAAKLRLAVGEVVEVECLACLKIVNLEEGYICNEYFRPREEIQSSSKPITTEGGTEADNTPSAESLWDSLDEFLWTDDLEELRSLLGAG